MPLTFVSGCFPGWGRPQNCAASADGGAAAGGIEYAPITVSFATEKAKAGFAHEVTLTFKGTDITPTAKITKWNEGDKVDKEIK